MADVGGLFTYIRVSSDELNDGLIEVSGISLEGISNAVHVLNTLEDIRCNRELRPFSELGSLILALEVDILHPVLVGGSRSVGDVLLEDDDVGIGDFYGIRLGEDGSSTYARVRVSLCLTDYCVTRHDKMERADDNETGMERRAFWPFKCSRCE